MKIFELLVVCAQKNSAEMRKKMQNNKDTLTMFMEALDAIKEYASVKGSPITKEDIEQYFKGLTLNEQQLNMVYQYVADVKAPESDTIFEQEEEIVTLSAKDYENDKKYIEMYIKDLEHIEPLSDTTRAFLLINIVEDNDKQSLKILSESLLCKIVEWIQPYRNKGVLSSDLIQEANLAMMGYMSEKRFLNHYDWKEQIKEGLTDDLLSVLDKMEKEIKQEIEDALMMMIDEQTSSNKMAGKVLYKVNFVNDWALRLKEELGRNPTVEEIAKKTGISVDNVRQAIHFTADNMEFIDSK